ncbi:MAG TPA: TIGR02281 family clan AA aspartic protease [Caulobacteraceae bacterium]|jgi:aspartyl protease family protein|nr:TIGR02281 family clan AA aspartic protease [Caulobacteraceae bacterium]
MFRHAAILVLAVLSALAAAQGLLALATPRAAVAAEASTTVAAAPAQTAQAPSAAEVAKGPDGHYWAQADVDGRWVKFLVDTGASAVALTPADAQRLGLDLARLDYDRPVVTANGQTKAAAVTLAHVTVAGARVDDVNALVVREGLSTSLLGMSYLGRLSRFEATKTALILRP